MLYKDIEKVPPIVSEELWDKAAQIRAKRDKKYGKALPITAIPIAAKLLPATPSAFLPCGI